MGFRKGLDFFLKFIYFLVVEGEPVGRTIPVLISGQEILLVTAKPTQSLAGYFFTQLA